MNRIMRYKLFLFLTAIAIYQIATDAQITVNYNAGPGLRNVVDSAGTPLPDLNEVRIGYFDAGFDVAANANNLLALDSAWNLFDTTGIRNIPPFGAPQPGRFADSASSSDAQ